MFRGTSASPVLSPSCRRFANGRKTTSDTRGRSRGTRCAAASGSARVPSRPKPFQGIPLSWFFPKDGKACSPSIALNHLWLLCLGAGIGSCFRAWTSSFSESGQVVISASPRKLTRCLPRPHRRSASGRPRDARPPTLAGTLSDGVGDEHLVVAVGECRVAGVYRRCSG